MKGKFEFSTDNKLNLVIGTNGAGKTELLYAFWWVLFDFDFSKLQNKKSTPYALNSDLYNQMQTDPTITAQSCIVVLEFDYKSKNELERYRIKRTRDYTKTPSGIIKETDYVEISKFKSNGELTQPIRNIEEFNKIIDKIIPKKILSGILFDGERMKILSSEDENSIAAIEGIVSDITNQEILQQALIELKTIYTEYNRDLKKVAKKFGDTDLDELTQKISEDEELQTDLLKKIEMNNQKIPYTSECINDISRKLQDYIEVRSLEERRNSKSESLKRALKKTDELLNDFSSDLKFGYYFISEELFSETEKLLENYDVPKGLTVDAVRSILEKDSCICGCNLSDESRKTLAELLDNLPPDNINATIGEIVRQNRMRKKDKMRSLQDAFNRIADNDNEISEYKKEIAELTTTIGDFNDDEVKKIENERRFLQRELYKLESENTLKTKELEQVQKRIIKQKQDRDDFASKNTETNEISKRILFIEKCLRLIQKIIEHNKQSALEEINNLIDVSYKELSEDYGFGRRIYITQFHKPKYRIITYYVNQYKNLLEIIEWGKIKNKYPDIDFESLEGKHEAAILEIAQSNSTGQGKTNSLSFVKAILNYSINDKSDQFINEKKVYPLIIDAPFTDLSGDNLKSVASKLCDFNSQTIVMLDPDIYQTVGAYFENSVGNQYQLLKSVGKSSTEVVRK